MDRTPTPSEESEEDDGIFKISIMLVDGNMKNYQKTIYNNIVTNYKLK